MGLRPIALDIGSSPSKAAQRQHFCKFVGAELFVGATTSLEDAVNK